MTTAELRRQQEEAAWAGATVPVRRSGHGGRRGGADPAARLRKGQEEEAQARRDGLRVPPLPAGCESRKPRFVKITPGVHVQTRGPIVFAKHLEDESGEWWIYRLPGTERIESKTPRSEILRRVGEAEFIAGPFAGLGRAKDYVRPIIVASDEELGS